MANPASENCTAQDGTLTIETRGDRGQYEDCYFEDNQQCEEWALLHGDCSVGWIKVIGYVTIAGRCYAITGGAYAITGNSGQDDEQGTCTLLNGVVCEVWDYWNGECDAFTVPTEAMTAGLTIQPLPMEVCDGQAQAMFHALDDLIPTQSEEIHSLARAAPATSALRRGIRRSNDWDLTQVIRGLGELLAASS